jgi:glycosyltransferase involved in cell wall biosynthesis
MRVLHVTPCYAPAYRYGGPIQSVERLVEAHRLLGVEQRVVTTNADGERVLNVPRGWTMRNRVPTQYFRRWIARDISPFLLLEAYNSSRWADIVHVTGVFSVTSVLGLMAARAACKPVVLSIHGALQPIAMQTREGRKRAWLQVFRNLYDEVGLFCATANHEASAIREIFGANCRVAIVPNGTEAITDEDRAIIAKVPRDSSIIGMMGRLHPIKAVDRVLEAMATLRQRGLITKLKFAGPVEDPAYRDALLLQARRLDLADSFELVGSVYGVEKLRFYAGCAILVVASHSENFGNVVVEALNVGTPVVASHGTPWAELADLGCGAWVDNQPQLLADAIAPYIISPELRASAGEAGRLLVKRKYLWPDVARQMAKIYELEIDRCACPTDRRM